MRPVLLQVYNDVGISGACLEQLLLCLQSALPTCTVEEITGEEIKRGHWKAETSVLCFGGGYDLGFLQTLGDGGCAQIRQYIMEGGRFLGICAGAYFASAKCEFDLNGPLEVLGNRFIKLFPGVASGPAYGGFEYNSERGAYAPVLRATQQERYPFSVTTYFNGGCTFYPADAVNTRVLYEYSDLQTPAIIACRLGRGWGILSGAHFEFDPLILRERSSATATQLILPKLLAGNKVRMQLVRSLLTSLVGINKPLCPE